MALPKKGTNKVTQKNMNSSSHNTQSTSSSASNLIAAMNFNLPSSSPNQQQVRKPDSRISLSDGQANRTNKFSISNSRPMYADFHSSQKVINSKVNIMPPMSLTNLAQLSGITLVKPLTKDGTFAQSSHSIPSSNQRPSKNQTTDRLNRKNILSKDRVLDWDDSGFVFDSAHNATIPRVISIRGRPRVEPMDQDLIPEPLEIRQTDSTNAKDPSRSTIIIPKDDLSDNSTNSPLSVHDLVKLVAILNNPALTITPVNSIPISNAQNSQKSNEFTSSTMLSGSQANPNSQINNLTSQSRSFQSVATIDESYRSLNQNNGDSFNNLNMSAICNDMSSKSNNFATISAAIQNSRYSTIDNTPTYVNKICDPNFVSTSVRNLIMQQPPGSGFNENPQNSVSVHLMQHIANHTKDDWNSMTKNLDIEPVIVNRQKNDKRLGMNEAQQKADETCVRTSIVRKKSPKEPIQTSQKRLYVPRKHADRSLVELKSIVNQENYNLEAIRIDNVSKESSDGELVSDRHRMLASMMPDGKNRKIYHYEPDEIFINRPKRIMSKIDTMIERKKSKRFLRISGRTKPKFDEIELQCQESDAEWSESECTFHDTIIKTHLPLEEDITDEKRLFLNQVGLLSRRDKDNLLIERREKKRLLLTPLHSKPIEDETLEGLKRLVQMLTERDGRNLQLRIESNIKRHELPLLEGLNRFTSRGKVTFMNALGLEKRSKRTALYKVSPVQTQPPTNTLQEIKLSSQDGVSTNGPDHNLSDKTHQKQQKTELLAHNISCTENGYSNLTTCRAVLKPTTKNEFMKSLGLMSYVDF